MKSALPAIVMAVVSLALACRPSGPGTPSTTGGEEPTTPTITVEDRLDKYTTVRLAPDLSELSETQRQMIPLLVEAAQAMDELFWRQAFGNREALLSSLDRDATRGFAEINYGPWDRLADNEPFLDGYGPKPPGANFYPENVTREEIKAIIASDPAREEDLLSLYTLVRRDDGGDLVTVPYHEAFAAPLEMAAQGLREAAALADDAGLARYLELRAEALVTDDYQPSDMAWMDMKDNVIELVIGAIETYEDQLFGAKAAYEAFVLLKDVGWSRRLARYADLLPELQRGLPVPDAYKAEEPGTDSELNAYDALYYAGDANAGSKTIAINLPNDEQVQLDKGTRRLQIKNAMRAKFDEILVPIAGILIAEDQRDDVTFDAFFANTMFHEVAHGLGIKNTVDGDSTVREALADQASALEEGKADVLGLYMVDELIGRGEFEGDPEDHMVTFFASIFRSIRFGTASAHGRANLARFNFFREREAFQRDESTGTYRVDLEKTREALTALSERILTLQGDGDYEGVQAFVERYQVVGPQLRVDLDRLTAAEIPVDIVFEQGIDVLDGVLP